MSNCGECNNCGANHIAMRVVEKIDKDYVSLTRVCGICGYEQDAGSITMAQYECAHRQE